MIVSAGYNQDITYQRQKTFQVVPSGHSKPPDVTLSQAKDISWQVLPQIYMKKPSCGFLRCDDVSSCGRVHLYD